MTIIDNHSLSPRWLKGRNCQPVLRWPYYKETETLEVSNRLGRRIAVRRGLFWRDDKWIHRNQLKAESNKMSEFMRTADGCSVSDHDLPQFAIDLLWEIFESIDENGNTRLTDEVRFNIEAALKMVGILDKGCGSCKGRGWGTKPDIREDGKHHGWIVQECPFCGGHGHKVYKRDVRHVAESEG